MFVLFPIYLLIRLNGITFPNTRSTCRPSFRFLLLYILIISYTGRLRVLLLPDAAILYGNLNLKSSLHRFRMLIVKIALRYDLYVLIASSVKYL